MAKPVEGTKQRKIQVLRGQNNTRQMRCKKCGNLTSQVQDAKGGMQDKCLFCGTVYSVLAI